MDFKYYAAISITFQSRLSQWMAPVQNETAPMHNADATQ